MKRQGNFSQAAGGRAERRRKAGQLPLSDSPEKLPGGHLDPSSAASPQPGLRGQAEPRGPAAAPLPVPAHPRSYPPPAAGAGLPELLHVFLLSDGIAVSMVLSMRFYLQKFPGNRLKNKQSCRLMALLVTVKWTNLR